MSAAYSGPTASQILSAARAAGEVFYVQTRVSECILYAQWLENATNDPAVPISALLRQLETTATELSRIEYIPAFIMTDGRLMVGVYEMIAVGMSYVNPNNCFIHHPIGRYAIDKVLVSSANRLKQTPAYLYCH
jgi:hypothetical protein